jgi:YVTN family beta-propeller protein
MNYRINKILLLVFVFVCAVSFGEEASGSSITPKKKTKTKLNLLKTITGKISPKSVVYNEKGLFFAQNMMYRHTVTVYNRDFELVKTISDEIKLSDYGEAGYKGKYKGSPVECSFSHYGKYAWVSNYEMKGGTKTEFIKPGCDGCTGTKYDDSYVYKINTSSFEIESAIKVGAVPKYIATTPNNKYVLVSNWTSGDLSIIDTETNKEVKRVNLGRLPRGIDINSTSDEAYVAIMGSNKIAKVNLINYEVSWIKDVGRGPRHLCVSPNDKYLYATINNEGKVAKINIADNSISYVRTGSQPRSMDISKDGKFIYVVNYNSNKLSKIRTSDMKIVHESKTNSKPIGVTFDDEKNNVWVACYTGKIMVFHDTYYDSNNPLIYATKEEEDVHSFLANGFLNESKKIVEIEKESPKPVFDKPVKESKFKEKGVKLSYAKFLVVSGSYKSERNAKKRVRLLKKKGYDSGIYYNEQKNMNLVYLLASNSKKEAFDFSKSDEERSWVFTIK